MEQVVSRLGLHNFETFESNHEGGRRKRKLLLKHYGSGDHHSKEIKKMVTMDDSFIEGISIYPPPKLAATQNNDIVWKCDRETTITVLEANSVEEKTVHFEDYYGSWILDDNGDICLAKEYSSEMCNNDTKIELDNTSSNSCLDSSVISNRGNAELCAVEEREQSNLSWLLNFKVDTLFKSEDVKHDHNYPNNQNPNTTTTKKGNGCRKDRAQNSSSKHNSQDPGGLCTSDSKSNTRKCQESSTLSNENVNRFTQQRKPPFTYSDLIERSLKESGELTVSGIYNWISEHYPYYKADDDRWKNSVRHNLSINPHFRKGRKSSQGAGHLWCIASSCKDTDVTLNDFCNTDINGVTIEEVEAATASIEEDKENRQGPIDDVYFFDTNYCGQLEEEEYSTIAVNPFGEQSLVHTAEQVLKGVKKEVEVQFVMPSQKRSVFKESEFLNPIPMEEVVEESGLNYQLAHSGISEDGTSFLITEINPIALGINMVEGEIITTDILFSDDDVSCFV